MQGVTWHVKKEAGMGGEDGRGWEQMGAVGAV